MAVIRELHADETHLARAAMAELRPVAQDIERFVAQVDEVQRPQGYRLLAAFEPEDTDAVSVVGFRRSSCPAWGDVLYIDDLSTRPGFRRRGHARALLDAVASEAAALGCDGVHLDSGHHRHDAHRLYLAAGFQISAHHFARTLR